MGTDDTQQTRELFNSDKKCITCHHYTHHKSIASLPTNLAGEADVSAAGFDSTVFLSLSPLAGFVSSASAFFSGSLVAAVSAAGGVEAAAAAGSEAGEEVDSVAAGATGLGVAALAFGLLTITTTKFLSLML